MFASSNQVLTEVGTKLIQVAPKFNQSWIQLEMKPFTYSNEITQKMRMWKTPVENAKSSKLSITNEPNQSVQIIEEHRFAFYLFSQTFGRILL